MRRHPDNVYLSGLQMDEKENVRSCFKIIKLDFSVGYVFYKVPID